MFNDLPCLSLHFELVSRQICQESHGEPSVRMVKQTNKSNFKHPKWSNVAGWEIPELAMEASFSAKIIDFFRDFPANHV